METISVAVISKSVVMSEERRRVRSHGRQIAHQAGKGDYVAKATRRASELATVTGIRACQHGQRRRVEQRYCGQGGVFTWCFLRFGVWKSQVK
jgi:hypothetical protein